MKNIDFDKIWIGLVFGLFAPFLALSGYYLVSYQYMPVGAFIAYLKLGNIITSVISLCILTNLAVFYPFIWKEKYKGARGVLTGTFVWAVIVMYLKFFA